MQKLKKEYQIRSYECDVNGHLRLITLMNILQDMADAHAEKLGLGMDFCMQNGFAWFGSNYHIKIMRLPKAHELIQLKTWPSGKTKIGAVRDFEVFDQNHNLIIAATSLWILIDFAKKRPLAIDRVITNYTPLDEHALAPDFAKLPLVENPEKTCCFAVRYDDVDFNKHVNNAVYLLWASECCSPQFRQDHIPAEIEISYKKECKLGDHVNVLVSHNNDTTNYTVQTKEALTSAQIRIKWQTLPR